MQTTKYVAVLLFSKYLQHRPCSSKKEPVSHNGSTILARTQFVIGNPLL